MARKKKGKTGDEKAYEDIDKSADSAPDEVKTEENQEELAEGEQKEEVSEKKTGRFKLLTEKFSIKTLYIITGVLAGLILMLIIAAAVLAIVFKKDPFAAPPGAISVKMSSSRANNANYSYADEKMRIGEYDATLKKILIDSRATRLYFDESIGVDVFDVLLVDDLGNTYYPDLSHHISEKPINSLKFQPLNEGVRYFSLRYKSGDNFAEKFFFLDQLLKHRDSVKTDKIVKEYSYGKNNSYVAIEAGEFSSDLSSIYYSFSWDNDSYRITTKNNEPLDIHFYEDKSRLPTSGNQLSPSSYEDTVIGRADFIPLRSIDSTVNIKLMNLTSQFKLDKSLDTGKLFEDKEDSFINIDAGDYRVVFERMAKSGGTVIAVAHIIDKTLPRAMNEYDYSNRIEPDFDIDLIYTDINNKEQLCKGTVIGGTSGCDIVFKDDSLAGVPPTGLSLRVNSFSVPVNDVTFSIELMEARSDGEMDDTDDTGNTGIADITAAEAAHNAVLSKFLEDGSKNLMYTAQIIEYSINAENDKFYCQVWEAVRQSDTTGINKYNLVAEFEAGEWQIKKKTKL